QVAAAGTGVRLSDGSTNILPVGSTQQVDAAWALHGRFVMRSLRRGFYQGWDMHPAQLPSRSAATYAFFREGLAEVLPRLENCLGAKGGDVLGEPATAKAMAGLLLRGIDGGAVSGEGMPFEPSGLRAGLGQGEGEAGAAPIAPRRGAGLRPRWSRAGTSSFWGEWCWGWLCWLWLVENRWDSRRLLRWGEVSVLLGLVVSDATS